MLDRRRSLLARLLAVALLLGSPASAQDSQPEAVVTNGEVVANGEEADSPTAELEMQWAALSAERQYALALDEDAREAIGDDRIALEATSLEVRLKLVDQLGEITATLLELEGNKVDVARYRSELLDVLPKMSGEIQQRYVAAQGAIVTLQTEREKAAAEAALDLQHRILIQEQLLERILAAGLEQAEMLSAFDLPSEAERTWLGERLTARARLLSGRMHLATSRIAHRRI
jgi:hypothetical protein